MNFIFRIVLLAALLMLLAYGLPFVHVYTFKGTLLFVLILSLLNMTLKPLLVLLTIPITIITLGLFLIVLNGIMVLIADHFIRGIDIGAGLLGAMAISIILSFANEMLSKALDK